MVRVRVQRNFNQVRVAMAVCRETSQTGDRERGGHPLRPEIQIKFECYIDQDDVSSEWGGIPQLDNLLKCMTRIVWKGKHSSLKMQ